ncbi:MAG: glycosyltransferase family 4 protein [Gemmataceae bacterium]|nr:glycosyltransferase family 4 protein [Gemmataceae bacterium]
MPSLLMVTTVPETLRAFLLPFADHFRQQGYRLDALARGVSQDADCVRAFDHVWDVDWTRNPLSPGNLRAARQVREIVARAGYDLVHVHTPVAAFGTRFALRGLRRTGRPRVLYTAHGFHFYQGGPRVRCAVFRTLERVAAQWTDYLIVINREDEEAARRYRLAAPGRLRYMPGIGVDTTRYGSASVPESAVAHRREELGLSPSDALLLMVAEFIPRKRHRDVLQAFARLNRRDGVLALAGTGPLLEKMKGLASVLGIADRVRFLGFRRDIPALARAAAALLLPSEQEGLPRSVMEAMAMGVPVIGSRIRGMTDLLEDGCGLLVPVGDVAGLAQAMTRILDHPQEARAMGERARRRAADYDLRHIIALHETLYDEALREPHAAPLRPVAAVC